MSLAPTRVNMLAFDHRQVLRDLLGKDGETAAAERRRLSDGKSVVVEALELMTVQGIEDVGILVDEEYGADAARAAKKHGISLAMPVEASRTEILEFQYGGDYPEHVESFKPDIVKLLVFHNPNDDSKRRATQIARTLEVSRWCETHDYLFMLEMLVPPTPEQSAAVGGDRERFTRELHTELLRRSIEQYQDTGVEPDLWKVEGLPSVRDFDVIAQQARAGRRDQVGCIVLGNGANLDRVEEWLNMAASVEGFTGFAVGRSIWYEPLRAFYFDGVNREETKDRIADAFARLAMAFGRGR